MMFALRHGELLIFLYVFADQIGIPVPAVPGLLAVGALAAVGKINVALALVASVGASLLADLIWYGLGRRRGHQVLRLMCRISLEPDSCVRRTEDVFIRYGVRSLIVAKFVPGLSTVAPPLAGMTGVRLPRFIAYSVAAGFLWAATWGGLGYVTGEAVQRVTNESARVGRILAALVAAGLVIYVGGKWMQRRRFLRNLRVAQISQDDVKRALDAGESIVIVDLRSPLDVATVPFMIPGSLRIAPDDLERRHQNIPRDRDIVLYCSCPSEATSARAALTLRRRGVTRVRPLEGGFPAWHARGLPVEAVPAAPRP
jgi:membrane protein DedA with SNARE-associated domain